MSYGGTNTYNSDALGSSVLHCMVYAKRKVGSDDFVGETKNTIESLLLAEGAAGGLSFLFLNPFL
jgi:hypothetical protein